MKWPAHIIVRDDDISYFTDIRKFMLVHRLLLKRSKPFVVAVVPQVSDHIPARRGGMEGFIPDNLSNLGRYYEIGQAGELISTLQSIPGLEIAQHGFNHMRQADGRAEYDREDQAEIARQLLQGKQILKNAFSRSPAVFVPPFDTVSRSALLAIRQHFSAISFAQFPHGLLPMRLWPRFKFNKWRHRHHMRWGKFSLFTHPGSDLSFMEQPVWPMDVLVVVIHSWQFFDERGELLSWKLAQYEELLEKLLHSSEVGFTTFSQLAKS